MSTVLHHLARAALPALLVGACHTAPAASAAPRTRPLVGVVTKAGLRLPVRVDLADTDELRELGLMHRRALGPDEGMLFLFDAEHVQTFWMHNTLIPLDMIFVRSDGTIAGIVANAAPQTDTPRTVGVPSRYVLEVNGGWCALHGVAAGDRLDLAEALGAAGR